MTTTVVDTTHKDVLKLCIVKCGIEVATIAGQSEEFQCIGSTALVEHLEATVEDSSDYRTPGSANERLKAICTYYVNTL